MLYAPMLLTHGSTPLNIHVACYMLLCCCVLPILCATALLHKRHHQETCAYSMHKPARHTRMCGVISRYAHLCVYGYVLMHVCMRARRMYASGRTHTHTPHTHTTTHTRHVCASRRTPSPCAVPTPFYHSLVCVCGSCVCVLCVWWYVCVMCVCLSVCVCVLVHRLGAW
jgi:hypothetical protein